MFKEYRTNIFKKKCPDCTWGLLQILEYTDGDFVFDCHKCGYSKDLSKNQIKMLNEADKDKP